MWWAAAPDQNRPQGRGGVPVIPVWVKAKWQKNVQNVLIKSWPLLHKYTKTKTRMNWEGLSHRLSSLNLLLVTHYTKKQQLWNMKLNLSPHLLYPTDCRQTSGLLLLIFSFDIFMCVELILPQFMDLSTREVPEFIPSSANVILKSCDMLDKQKHVLKIISNTWELQ